MSVEEALVRPHDEKKVDVPTIVIIEESVLALWFFVSDSL